MSLAHVAAITVAAFGGSFAGAAAVRLVGAWLVARAFKRQAAALRAAGIGQAAAIQGGRHREQP